MSAKQQHFTVSPGLSDTLFDAIARLLAIKGAMAIPELASQGYRAGISVQGRTALPVARLMPERCRKRRTATVMLMRLNEGQDVWRR